MIGDVNAQVRDHLGDSLSVTLADADAPITIIGFLTTAADAGGVGGYDSMRQQWSVKIDKTPENLLLLPDGPDSIILIEHPRLDGPYRPGTGNAANAGDEGGAWAFDLQRAPLP